jgi:hypothetical protein
MSTMPPFWRDRFRLHARDPRQGLCDSTYILIKDVTIKRWYINYPHRNTESHMIQNLRQREMGMLKSEKFDAPNITSLDQCCKHLP